MKKYHKVTNKKIDQAFLDSRVSSTFGKQKWITFCESLLEQGYQLKLHEARQTFSKYIYVSRRDDSRVFKVRFSNHRPNFFQEERKDCDFYVGVSNNTVTTTSMALRAVESYFMDSNKGEHYE